MGHRKYLDGVQAQTRVVCKKGPTAITHCLSLTTVITRELMGLRNRQFRLQLLFKCKYDSSLDTAHDLGESLSAPDRLHLSRKLSLPEL